MSLPVIWPENNVSYVTGTTLTTLPSDMHLHQGVFYAGFMAQEKHRTSDMRLAAVKEEMNIRISIIRNSEPGRLDINTLLSTDIKVRTGQKGQGVNEDFVRYVNKVQGATDYSGRPGKKNLIDVGGLVVKEDGTVVGVTKFNPYTKNTTEFATTFLPFVSNTREKYLKAVDLYGGVGSYPDARNQISTQDGKKSRPTSEIGIDWFIGGPYKPQIKNESKSRSGSSGRLEKTTIKSIVDKANVGGYGLDDRGRLLALEDLRRFFAKEPAILTLSQLTTAKERGYSAYTADYLNTEWNVFVNNNLQEFLNGRNIDDFFAAFLQQRR